MEKINVVCVFWQGDFRNRNYSIEDVERLYRMVSKQLSMPFKFWCLSNVSFPGSSGINWITNKRDDLPGWWLKLELFCKDLPIPDGEKILYLDLDTIICGSLDEVVNYSNNLTFCPPIKPVVKKKRVIKKNGKDVDRIIITRFQSSVITWIKGKNIIELDKLFEKFDVVNSYRGDQDVFGIVFDECGFLFPAKWFDKILNCKTGKSRKELKVVLGNPKHLYRRMLKKPPKWIRKAVK